ncbi:structural maintenance of chromosomes flexible hinge domain-containing protein 1-like isoform X1 [Haliotis cracherodii]|uniref:structural maintenance of chromosomes flexible hinge domain-containing protein 1-like isoform X1 n=1 Tax=Haliotis cracherodii TaxID=6455 RepID=UPI0039EAB22E
MASSKMAAPTVEDDDAFVFVFDRRSTDAPEVKIPTGGLFNFVDFKERVREALDITKRDQFVIATTNRDEIKDDESWDMIDKGDTLYVMKHVQQELCAPAQERVNYLPHYDTIVKGGMYEYYASEGQNPLPYAFAELIDNALAATADNNGPRKIDIRLHFDDANPSRSCISVIDNGKGMTPRQLNNWAIYRLSKFIRKEKGRGPGSEARDSNNLSFVGEENVPRYMNSDISYFGVGGKQAIFYIGSSTRMISKPKDSRDVHELTISKEEFEKKEKNNEAIYSGFIRNRKPCDNSHIPAEDEIIRRLVLEENKRESFTAVVIQLINPSHIPYLKHKMKEWTRQLSHIYHYYLHGPDGNVDDDTLASKQNNPFKNIDIEVSLYTRGGPQPKVVNLRDVGDDMQSMFLHTASSNFEFKALVDGTNIVEGVLRYHPFLYDRETFPSEAYDPRMDPEPEDDHDYAINDRPARGRRPVFECYWNGRLIPYTLIEDFEWCCPPKKPKAIPSDCYNRVSGVLWTNDSFQVSTNKLTFLDLEMKLRDKSTSFSRIHSGHEKRTSIEKEFVSWLKECHDKHDKQIFFSSFRGTITRTDLPKHKQSPWAVYDQVEWDGRLYKKGSLVKIMRTLPPMMGTIKCFMLYGDHDGEVYSTGGDLEIIQEPRSVYDDTKIVPLSRLDRTASHHVVKKFIEDEEAKLPDSLIISWPEGNEVKQNGRRPAGETVGDVKVEICNKRGEMISKLPGTAATSKKLLVELKIIWHSPDGDEVIVSHISQHGKNWPYWFRKMENVKNLGPHTLQLQTVLNESGATMFAGKELPSYKIRFTVTEAEPERFTVGLLDGPFKVGVPFQIPLEFQDKYNHPAKPPSKLKPDFTAAGLELSYSDAHIKGNSIIIRGVEARGTVTTSAGKNFNLTVKIPGLEEDSQSLKIRLLPGPANALVVTPEDMQEIENGSPVSFNVVVQDVANNVTSEGKQIITCKFSGASGLPTYIADCSNSSSCTLTGDALTLKKLVKEQVITAKIDIQGMKNVQSVEKKILVKPSFRVTSFNLTYGSEANNKVTRVSIPSSGEITGIAGQPIKDICFKLFDEGGRETTLDEQLASKVKVNWVPKVSREVILQGKLPDIKIPNSVSESKYCHVNLLQGPGVEFTFTVRCVPGPPSQLKCVCQGTKALQVGQELDQPILVTIKDKHGNSINDLPPSTAREIKVSGALLNSDSIRVSSQQKNFVVHGVKFDKAGVGTQELEVTWNGLKDYVRLEVAAGPPAQLELIGWTLEQAVAVYNDSKLPHSLKVQLLDEAGNPSKTADIKIQIAKDPKIKLIPAPQPLKTNAQGITDFGLLTVSATRGVYDIQPKAFYNKSVISGPKIKLNVQSDPTRPVELQVDYSKNAAFVAGDIFPEFSVKVMAEDDSVMATANPTHLSMKLWKCDSANQNMPPSRTATSMSPDTPLKSDKGVFHFRKRSVPEQAGAYNVMFVFFDGKHELYSTVISINVMPGQPVEISPQDSPGTPTVSNTRNAASRCLIRHLKLTLKDKFGNHMGEKYNGRLTLEITAPEGVTEIPCFVGGTKSLDMSMLNGQVHLQNLMLQENTPGKDGLEYVLKCHVSCDIIPRNRSIPHYEIPFLFYNDAKKQSQMAALSKERDNLQSTIRAYKSMFETQQQLVSELRISVLEATREEQNIRGELRKQNIPASQLQDMGVVDKLVAARVKEREQLLKVPRRLCGLPPAPKDHEVLGKIAHLGRVEDNDIARVMSWHMSADMDCVVTLSTKKAKEIYHQTNGKQQVLPLDSIYRKNLPDWGKPLPHTRFRPSWTPPGNPVYARDMLLFPQDQENCRIVFGMLLGDTLILDTLDHANSYRQEIIKHTHCPTILTRNGDRIRSNGKFGGTMNKALPVEKLRGAVFSEPLPMAYHALCTQIDTLQSYKGALERQSKAKTDLQEQIECQKLPEMVNKYTECQDAQRQLKDIEHKLGVGLQPRQRPPSSNSDPRLKNSNTTETPSKRQRTLSGSSSSTTVSNSHQNGEVTTPTRASKRIASMTTVVAEDGRKKLRKT